MIGVINIFKEKHMSSADVVRKVKSIIPGAKVGHLGTLDPLARGVLPICLGKATRIFSYFLKEVKTYVAYFKFGEQTDTLDLEGRVIKKAKHIPSISEIEDTIKSNFLGDIMQTPPIYSSKKVGGKRSSDMARRGKEVKLEPALVTIFEFKLLEKVSDDTFKFEITCSSGTYIRALARDLGEKTNSCAMVIDLVRTKMGNFSREDSINVNDLSYETICNNLIPLEKVLSGFDRLEISRDTYIKLRDGVKVIDYKDKNLTNPFTVYCHDKLIGMGEITKQILKIKTYFA